MSAHRYSYSILTALLLFASPAPAAESVWIEGEKPSGTSFRRHGWYDGVNKEVLSGKDWLSHYGPEPGEASYEFSIREGGGYALWVRLNDLLVTQLYRVDGGRWTLCDLDADPRERITISPKPDHRRIAWHRLGKIRLRKGRHRIEFRLTSKIQNHGGIDCFVLTNTAFVPSGTRRPSAQEIAPAGPSDWFEVIPDDDTFSKKSITDMSRLLHKPAGKRGFVKRRGDKLTIGQKEVKFWGCGANIQPRKPRAWQEQWARYLAKHGINMVRQHPVEKHLGLPRRDPRSAKLAFDEGKLEQWDRWFATLKKHGIYMTWSVFYPHYIRREEGYDLFDDLPEGRRPDGGRSTGGAVNLERELQDSQWRYLELLLLHRNSHTGLRYVDDPALAVIEVHNEDCIFWHSPLNDLASGKRLPRHAQRLKARWATWLEGRYGTDESLRKAWGAGMRKGDSIRNPRMGIYGAWEMKADGPVRNPRERRRMGDFIRFLAEEQRAFYERREERLRELGYKAVTVTTAWRAGGAAADAANLWCDDAMDMIDRHNYLGGGEGRHRIRTGRVNNVSHLKEPGSGLLSIGLYQIEDKPFSVTEWTMMPPDQWKAEAAPLVAFYGMGLQGWDASYHFLSSHNRLEGGWPDQSWYAMDTPHYVGQFPALALALYRGHIKEAPIVAARRLELERIFQGIDAVEQDFTGGEHDVKELKGEPSTPQAALAIGRITLKIAGSVEDPSNAHFDEYWDRENRVIRSVTGELTWDYAKGVVTLEAPKTQAVIGFAGGTRRDLPGVRVDVETSFVSLIFSPLDDRPLKESKHILITAMARDRQTGTEYSENGDRLMEIGSPPLLMEPVQATIRLLGAPIRSVRAVDIYGVPTDRTVPVRENRFTIDGRYRACYYEVKR